jgi:hypothetical protein
MTTAETRFSGKNAREGVLHPASVIVKARKSNQGNRESCITDGRLTLQWYLIQSGIADS